MVDGELGSFLRSRREAVTPAQVGLPERSRRRTPGLRRAELATLAGVSVDYLIRLEQGRDTHPCAQVLAALADALQLSEEDLGYLRRLAAVSNGTELFPQARSAARIVRPNIQALLDRLEPSPGFVVNHLGDLLAWTDGYDRLARPLGVLEGEAPNLLWFTFADPRARSAYPDWDDVADELVARLHSDHYGDGEALALLIGWRTLPATPLPNAGGGPLSPGSARGSMSWPTRTSASCAWPSRRWSSPTPTRNA